jgi:hypothetical protein
MGATGPWCWRSRTPSDVATHRSLKPRGIGRSYRWGVQVAARGASQEACAGVSFEQVGPAHVDGHRAHISVSDHTLG